MNARRGARTIKSLNLGGKPRDAAQPLVAEQVPPICECGDLFFASPSPSGRGWREAPGEGSNAETLGTPALIRPFGPPSPRGRRTHPEDSPLNLDKCETLVTLAGAAMPSATLQILSTEVTRKVAGRTTFCPTVSLGYRHSLFRCGREKFVFTQIPLVAHCP